MQRLGLGLGYGFRFRVLYHGWGSAFRAQSSWFRVSVRRSSVLGQELVREGCSKRCWGFLRRSMVESGRII